jgi:tripartite-type tricarboxylate transporter receptor subunit TctC
MRRLLVLFLAMAAMSQAVWAAEDAWPTRPIKLVVPFAPGGNTDVVARLTASYIQRTIRGANVVIENKGGAGGIIGTDQVAKAAPDGYTFCVCSIGAITISPATEKLPYDPLKDLAPVSLVNTNPLVLIVHPALPVKSVADVIALSKTKPEGLSYGSSGLGGLMYFSAEVFKAKTGANLVHVPYRGGAPATAAVVAGDVHLAFANMSDAIAQMSANTVRSLAVTTAKRSPYAPSLPTLIEQGIAGFSTESWNALFAPAGTPRAIIDRMARIIAEMGKDEAIQKNMAEFGSVFVANTPEEFAAMLRAETAQWAADLKGIALK